MTTTDQMTDAELNVAIAELAGWTNIQLTKRWIDDDLYGAEEITFLQAIPPGTSDSVDERPLPDYAHDLNATMAALRIAERLIQVVFRYSVYEKRSECMLLKTGGGYDAHICTTHGDTDSDFERATARALYALLLARPGEHE